MTSPTIYNIPEFNLPGLLAKLAKLSKKSVKLIGREVHLTVLEEVRKPLTKSTPHGWQSVRDFDGNQVFTISYNVTIDAEVPKINGWTFLATIDHAPSSGNIIRVNPNVDFTVPEKYRTVGPECDHCNKIRKRNDTFLLRCDATGEVKQIGRQCIRDFIGHDIEGVVALAELVRDATPSDSDGEGDWTGGRTGAYIFTRTFLAHTAAVIRAHGWVGRAQAKSDFGKIATSDDAYGNMFPPRQPTKFVPVSLTEKDFQLADAALAWGSTIVSKTEFDHNLSVVASETFIEYRSIAFLAYLIPGYMKHMNRAFEAAELRTKLAPSQPIGKVKDKLVDVSAVVFGFRAISGNYGTTVLYSFLTDDGNVLKWFASGDVDLAMIDATNRVPVLISGTIKGHSEYNGVKDTILTRCKITRVEVKAEAA